MKSALRPPVWKMVHEAMEALGAETTNVDVRDWILHKYPGTNKSTISCQIIICTVNHDSRVHYPENQKPRPCNTPYDFLFRPERGKLVRYEPAKHGEWEIAETDAGHLRVQLVGTPAPETVAEAESGGGFAAENHLRDYLVQNLDQIEAGLQLYTDEHGVDGVEFMTPIGRLDILAKDRDDRFVVIELKVGHGPDAVCGQLMRYMGWVKRHLAEGKPVRGIIVAYRISDRIRYALADMDNVQLKEYELSLKLRDAEPLQ